MSMTINFADNTVAFNEGGTWVQLCDIAEQLNVPVEDVIKAIDDLNLGYVGDELVDTATALLKEACAEELGLA